MVHRDQICLKSPFFAAECEKELGEGQTREVSLPTQSSKWFQYYIDWIYKGEVDLKGMLAEPYPWPLNETAPTLTEPTKIMRAATACEILCRTSVLADLLGDLACKNACMEHLVYDLTPKSQIRIIRIDTIDFVAKNTNVDSGLFKFVVDLIGSDFGTANRTKEQLARILNSLPVVLKGALLLTAFVALRPHGKLALVDSEASNYFDADVVPAEENEATNSPPKQKEGLPKEGEGPAKENEGVPKENGDFKSE